MSKSAPFFISCTFGGNASSFPVFNMPQLYSGLRQILLMIFLSNRSSPADFDILAFGRPLFNDDDLMDAMGQSFQLTGERKLQVYIQIFEGDGGQQHGQQQQQQEYSQQQTNSYAPPQQQQNQQQQQYDSPPSSVPSPSPPAAIQSNPSPPQQSFQPSPSSSPSLPPPSSSPSPQHTGGAVTDDLVKSCISRYFQDNPQWETKKFLSAQALTEVKQFLTGPSGIPEAAIANMDITTFSRECFFEIKKSRQTKQI